MFANLIIDSSVQSYSYNEPETVAALAVLEKFAGFAGVLMQAMRNLRAGFRGMVRLARA